MNKLSSIVLYLKMTARKAISVLYVFKCAQQKPLLKKKFGGTVQSRNYNGTV